MHFQELKAVRIPFTASGLRVPLTYRLVDIVNMRQATEDLAARFLYEHWLGHSVTAFTTDGDALHNRLSKLLRPGTVMHMLIGPSRLISRSTDISLHPCAWLECPRCRVRVGISSRQKPLAFPYTLKLLRTGDEIPIERLGPHSLSN